MVSPLRPPPPLLPGHKKRQQPKAGIHAQLPLVCIRLLQPGASSLRSPLYCGHQLAIELCFVRQPQLLQLQAALTALLRQVGRQRRKPLQVLGLLLMLPLLCKEALFVLLLLLMLGPLVANLV